LTNHPANSPDVTPIELVWHELKKLLRAQPRTPTSFGELITVVKECWEELDVADIDKYIKSMPERIQAVIGEMSHLVAMRRNRHGHQNCGFQLLFVITSIGITQWHSYLRSAFLLYILASNLNLDDLPVDPRTSCIH
jgi:hypothetical protein